MNLVKMLCNVVIHVFKIAIVEYIDIKIMIFVISLLYSPSL